MSCGPEGRAGLSGLFRRQVCASGGAGLEHRVDCWGGGEVDGEGGLGRQKGGAEEVRREWDGGGGSGILWLMCGRERESRRFDLMGLRRDGCKGGKAWTRDDQ